MASHDRPPIGVSSSEPAEIVDLVELVDRLDDDPCFAHLDEAGRSEIRAVVAAYHHALAEGSPSELVDAIHDIERVGRRLLGVDPETERRGRMQVDAAVEETHAELRVVLATPAGQDALSRILGDDEA